MEKLPSPEEVEQKIRSYSQLYNLGDFQGALLGFEWLASLDLPWYQISAGHMHLLGKGTPVNLERAESWLRLAAVSDMPEAFTLLGDVLMSKGDAAGAIQQYKLAADKEFPPAIRRIGIAFQQGMGLPINQSAAEKYYRKAILVGDPFSKLRLGRLYTTGKFGLLDRFKGLWLITVAIIEVELKARRDPQYVLTWGG